MKKNTLRIDFISFWPNFKKKDNYFYHLLNLKYKVIIDNKNPQIVFHSYDYSGSEEHKNFDKSKTLKIFFSGENVDPDLNESNFSFTFRSTNKNGNYRLPLWVLHINWFDIKYKKNRDIGYHIDLKSLLSKKNIINNEFCSFITSNPQGRRVDFFQKLNDIKKVDSGGRIQNNLNFQIKGRGDQHWKYNFLKKYKFNIAFENTIGMGYVSEKIIQPMSVGSIPIYWGDNQVKKDFNKDSFIFVNDFDNEDKLLDKIIELNNKPELYIEKLKQPWFSDNKIPENFLPRNILDYFEENILLKLK